MLIIMYSCKNREVYIDNRTIIHLKICKNENKNVILITIEID